MNDPKEAWTQRERPHSTWPCLELASFSLVSLDPHLSEWKAGQDGVSQPGLTTRAMIIN